MPYLEKVAARLRDKGIRVEVDDDDDRMQKKIRTAQRQKVPYMLLAGDDDVAAHIPAQGAGTARIGGVNRRSAGKRYRNDQGQR